MNALARSSGLLWTAPHARERPEVQMLLLYPNVIRVRTDLLRDSDFPTVDRHLVLPGRLWYQDEFAPVSLRIVGNLARSSGRFTAVESRSTASPFLPCMMERILGCTRMPQCRSRAAHAARFVLLLSHTTGEAALTDGGMSAPVQPTETSNCDGRPQGP